MSAEWSAVMEMTIVADNANMATLQSDALDAELRHAIGKAAHTYYGNKPEVEQLEVRSGSITITVMLLSTVTLISQYKPFKEGLREIAADVDTHALPRFRLAQQRAKLIWKALRNQFQLIRFKWFVMRSGFRMLRLIRRHAKAIHSAQITARDKYDNYVGLYFDDLNRRLYLAVLLIATLIAGIALASIVILTAWSVF